jgi:cobalamin biosynthesis Mg chelatase CobN
VVFKLPYVKSPTQWVERYLSPNELLLAWDLPATTIKDAPEEVAGPLSTLKMVPFKIRFHLGEPAGNALRKREEVVEEERDKRPRESSVLASPEPPNQKKARFESEAPSVQGVKEGSTTTLPEPNGSGGGQPIEESELDAREARNSKATKSDDAKVPVYLWDDGVAAVLARQHPAGPH